jgi:hypothetical protein
VEDAADNSSTSQVDELSTHEPAVLEAPSSVQRAGRRRPPAADRTSAKRTADTALLQTPETDTPAPQLVKGAYFVWRKASAQKAKVKDGKEKEDPPAHPSVDVAKSGYADEAKESTGPSSLCDISVDRGHEAPVEKLAEQKERVKRWLAALHPEHPGCLEPFLGPILDFCDGDLEKLRALRIKVDGSIFYKIDPNFFVSIGCTKGGLKGLLRRGILNL